MTIDRIFIISLERRIDERFKRIYNEISSQGLAHLVSLIIATDGQDLPPSLAEKETGWDLRPGERGCFGSHRRCWIQVLALNCSNALVLEDDVDCSNLASVIKEIENVPYDSYSIAAFGNRDMRETADGTFVEDKTKDLSGAWGCAAYTITPTAAKAFLKGCTTSFPKPVDWYMITHPVVQQHVAIPALLPIKWDGITDSST